MSRLIPVVMVVCTTLLGVRAYAPGRGGKQYCFYFGDRAQDTYFDPHSGVSLSKSNATAFLYDHWPFNESPDGNYAMYRTVVRSYPEEFALWLYPLRAGPRPQSILIVDNISQLDRSDVTSWNNWSPDSQQYAFIWQDSSELWEVTIIRPGGNKQLMVFSRDNNVVSYGWSADGAYYAFGLRRGTEQTRSLYFWSSASKQFVKTGVELQVFRDPDKLRDDYEMIHWSPVGHHLALISPSDNTSSVQLQIITPEGQNNRAFTFNTIPANPQFDWSPDGNYLALSSHPDLYPPTGPLWQLSVFGVDGSAASNISQRVTTYVPNDSPELVWGGDRLLYMDTPEQSHWSTYDGRLMAFDATIRHKSLLAANVDLESFYGPMQSLERAVWLENGKPIIGGIDLVSGKRYVLARGFGTDISYNDLSPDGRFAVVHFNISYQESLKIESVDASWETPLPLARADGVLWSPDGTLIALFDMSLHKVTIVDTNGAVVYQRQFKGNLSTITWQPCSSM